MIVEIFLKDKSLIRVHNVRKVTNSSTNIEKDWIYVYRYHDIDGQPSIAYPIEKIICVQVVA